MKEYYSSEKSQRGKDYDEILSEVRRNFEGESYQNVRQNLRFVTFFDHIACPIMVSNYSGVKKRSFPDAIGIGFAKSGTGSLAMLRSVCYFKRLLNGFRSKTDKNP